MILYSLYPLIKSHPANNYKMPASVAASYPSRKENNSLAKTLASGEVILRKSGSVKDIWRTGPEESCRLAGMPALLLVVGGDQGG